MKLRITVRAQAQNFSRKASHQSSQEVISPCEEALRPAGWMPSSFTTGSPETEHMNSWNFDARSLRSVSGVLNWKNSSVSLSSTIAPRLERRLLNSSRRSKIVDEEAPGLRMVSRLVLIPEVEKAITTSATACTTEIQRST